MNYAPKNNKLIKRFKSIKFTSCRGTKLNFGFVGIQAKGFGVLNTRQIEAGRRFLVRNLFKRTVLYRRLYLTYPKYKKSSGHMMGRGSKKNFHYWSGNVRSGQILFENNYMTPFFFKYRKKKLKRKYSFKQPRFLKIKHKFAFKIKLLKSYFRFNKKLLYTFFSSKKNFFFSKKEKKSYKKIQARPFNIFKISHFVEKYFISSGSTGILGIEDIKYYKKLNNEQFKHRADVKLFYKNKKKFASKRFRKKLQKRFFIFGKFKFLSNSARLKKLLVMSISRPFSNLSLRKYPIYFFFRNKNGRKILVNLVPFLNKEIVNTRVI